MPLNKDNKMYAKLFASMYQGTLRGHSHGLLVFTNLLAHCDAAGFVDIHPRAIADETGLEVPEVIAAIDYLEAPEADSRSCEFEGRRIVKIDDHRSWGWHVVNYLKYRQIRSEEDRRLQNKTAQEKYREKQKLLNSKQSKPRKPPSAQGEGEGEGEG